MDSLATVFIIVFVLVISIAGMTYIQRKEEAKAKIRQQIAQYRFRASEAVQILDNFSKIPIGLESRTLRTLSNLFQSLMKKMHLFYLNL